MRFWRRHAVLNLGGNSYTLDDLTFSFKVKFEDRPMVSTAELEVINLSPSMRGSIAKGMPLILSAGYKDSVGTIFVGEVSDFSVDETPPDIKTKITAADSLQAWLGSNINKTYKGPITAMEILEDLLNVFGVEVAMVKLAEDKTYSRGRVCNGKTKDVLTQIACADCKSRMIVRCGQIIINPPEEGIQSGFLLSPATGLLNKSARQEGQDTSTKTNPTAKDTRAAQNEADGTLKKVCLLNHRIGCADLVAIQDKTTNGTFLVKSGEHTGTKSGDWTTTLEVIPA